MKDQSATERQKGEVCLRLWANEAWAVFGAVENDIEARMGDPDLEDNLRELEEAARKIRRQLTR
jgi:hypothetical protein